MRIISFTVLLLLFFTNHYGYAQNKFTIGKNYYENSKYDSAQTCFSALINNCKGGCNDSVLALYKIYLGKTLNLQEEYAKALAEFVEATQLMEKASNQNGKAFALISLAELYRRNGKFDKATEVLDKVLQMITKGFVSKYNQAYCYSRYAAVKSESSYDSLAIITYSKNAIEIAKEFGYSDIEASSLNELGFYEQKKERFDKAVNYFKQSLEIEKKLKRPIYTASVICNLAMCYFKNGKYKIAEQYALDGIEIMRPINASNTKAFLYKIYSDALFKLNRYKESREALDEHLNYQTKVLEDYYSKSLAELEKKYEVKEKNDQIDLERQKTINAQQDAKNKNTFINYIIIGTTVLALLLALLFMAYRRIRRTNVQLGDALEKRNILLKEVNHRVKNNMQTVTSLLEMKSGQLKDEKEKQVFTDSINRIQALALAHQNLYNNDNYASIDLGSYLETLAKHIITNEEHRLDLTLVSNCYIDIEKAQAVGFILNELIANSIKYAWKNSSSTEKIISLLVKEDTDELYFHYADNGEGMQEKTQKASMGLSLIKSFVKRQLNGTINMYNQLGANTIITFKKNVSL